MKCKIIKIFILYLVTACLSACALISTTPKQFAPSSSKFTQFTFKKECLEGQPDPLLEEIRQELTEKGTVLDLMKFYSDELGKEISTRSPCFTRLQKIFNCGLAPQDMHGYLHGAVIAFQNEALPHTFDVNILNLAWPLARVFSPWTGKTFEPIPTERLKDITGGLEPGELPTTWGANTYTTRTCRQKASVDIMKALGMKIEPATSEEIQAYDFDIKGFFFIGRPGQSVNPENKGRRVYQFNYRWPKLETFPPDNYCMDEIVQIAEGLYLGQLVYATDTSREYDPGLDPSLYQYRNFGYFLLMDEDWQKRRIAIDFDVIK